MRKITKLFKVFLLVSFLLLMTNCATEEIAHNDPASSTIAAKFWFNDHKKEYNATVLKYVKDLQWENAIVSNGNIGEVIEIPFTFEENLSTSNKDANLYNDNHRLMFVKDEQNEFKLFYVQIFTNAEDSKIHNKDYNYYNVQSNFDGKVFVQELATNIGSKLEFKNGNKIIPSLTSRMAEEVIECVWLGYWHEDGHFEPIEVVYCSGGGSTGEEGGGGYGGGGTTPPAPSTTCPDGYEFVDGECRVISPPSCESFNFTSKPGSLWQEALVQNIYLRIVLVEPSGLEILHVISYPQPILFGTPTNVKMGNTTITEGIAANASAKVLHDTMDEVNARYGRSRVSEMVVDQYFRSKLIDNYPLAIPGGRVQFNSTSNLPMTQYKTTFLYSSDCR